MVRSNLPDEHEEERQAHLVRRSCSGALRPNHQHWFCHQIRALLSDPSSGCSVLRLPPSSGIEEPKREMDRGAAVFCFARGQARAEKGAPWANRRRPMHRVLRGRASQGVGNVVQLDHRRGFSAIPNGLFSRLAVGPLRSCGWRYGRVDPCPGVGCTSNLVPKSATSDGDKAKGLARSVVFGEIPWQ